MPYITEEQRQKVDDLILCLVDNILSTQYVKPDSTEGVLNYVITSIVCDSVLWNQDKPEMAVSCPRSCLRYKHYNAILGVLECVKQEIYRRLVASYEDEAIKKNGDIGVFQDW